MAKLEWDKSGEKLYETGVKKTVLFPQTTGGVYGNGVAWNGVTAINESPSGAEATSIFADDGKYGDIMSAEEFGATIEAYTYPEEFGACDGSVELTDGVYIGQQKRNGFGLVYQTSIGNDTMGVNYGYKLHLVYGAKASPSERNHSTINDSPEAETLSWELKTTPVNVTGHNPTAHLMVDSTKADAEKLAALEAVLFGSDDADARLPLPDEVKTIMTTGAGG